MFERGRQRTCGAAVAARAARGIAQEKKGGHHMRYTHIILATLCAVSLVSEAFAESPATPSCYLSKDRRSDQITNQGFAQLDTIDGIAVSRTQRDVLWTRSGSKLDARDRYRITTPWSWEVDAPAGADMALGLCNPRNVSRGDCLFIADIDAGTAVEARAIYKVPEPMQGSMNTQPLAADRYPIAYELAEGEEAPDAASLSVHPLTGTFYIVTREANEARVFEGAAPNLPGDTITFRAVGEVGLDQPTGADMSPDGAFFIVRNATDAVEYKMVNADMAAALMEPGERLPLEQDGDGQSIAYARLQVDYGFINIYLQTHTTKPFDLYTAGVSGSQPLFYYGYLCEQGPLPEPYDMRPPGPDNRDMGYRPDMNAEPSDLGVTDMGDAPDTGVSDDMETPDMGDASEDGPGEGCSSAGASAPAALLWLLAPLAARVRRRKGGDV
jgi:uncharacterized protein (TIGR03382 family)